VHRQQPERVVPADRGAVGVDAAALFAVEQQAGTFVGGLELHAHQAVGVHLERHRVLGQEVGGRHAEALLEADDVVGGKRDIGLPAAGVEAGDARVAAEADARVLLEQLRKDGAS